MERLFLFNILSAAILFACAEQSVRLRLNADDVTIRHTCCERNNIFKMHDERLSNRTAAHLHPPRNGGN